ncbi:MAG: type II toxin-antitoxin system RelB/DinJ family antitoxin [Clostridia bacterium]|nr:type II toxin-antitoxin system RelB/DinJ family antitoxin [Clostridia bacterium]
MTTINVRVDENVKKQATELFEELGLDMSTALNLFLRQAINYGGIPFEVKRNHPCAVSSKQELIAKLLEAEQSLQNGERTLSHNEVWANLGGINAK